MIKTRGFLLGAMVAWGLLIAAPAGALVTVVAPNANTAIEGSTDQTGVFWGNGPTTDQWVFAASQFSGVPLGSLFTGIGFRLDAGESTGPALALSTTRWDLQISRSLHGPGLLHDTFADNMAADVVTVRSGPLTLPANSFIGGPGPNPFTELLFTTPYLYTGGDLLLTLRAEAFPTSLRLDAVSVNNSTADSAGTGGQADATTASLVHYYNVPVTEFVVAVPAPEPATTGLALLALASLSGYALRRRTAPR